MMAVGINQRLSWCRILYLTNSLLYHSKKNVGKRKAQKHAFDMIGDKYDIIVMLDSDTVLAKDVLNQLVKHFNEKTIGAVTGYASVINRDYNMLTRLICCRYWVAFNLEPVLHQLDREII